MNPFEKSQCSFHDAMKAVIAVEELRAFGILTREETQQGLNEIRRQLGLPPLEPTKPTKKEPE